MKFAVTLITTALLLLSCKDTNSTQQQTQLADAQAKGKVQEPVLEIVPISHATMVLKWADATLYVDPVGGATAFEGQPAANLVLVTDIHGDHLNVETLEAVCGADTELIAPQAVAEKLSESLLEKTTVLANGEKMARPGIEIQAVPMYNLREEARNFHVKGRGNGYLIEKSGERIYISGDTEDIPEMRELKNIDRAFVCMNLPYTMTVESAADAVLDFAPKKVYPYHYRGSEGMSDTGVFARIVNEGDPAIEVIQLNWYPNRP